MTISILCAICSVLCIFAAIVSLRSAFPESKVNLRVALAMVLFGASVTFYLKSEKARLDAQTTQTPWVTTTMNKIFDKGYRSDSPEAFIAYGRTQDSNEWFGSIMPARDENFGQRIAGRLDFVMFFKRPLAGVGYDRLRENGAEIEKFPEATIVKIRMAARESSHWITVQPALERFERAGIPLAITNFIDPVTYDRGESEEK